MIRSSAATASGSSVTPNARTSLCRGTRPSSTSIRRPASDELQVNRPTSSRGARGTVCTLNSVGTDARLQNRELSWLDFDERVLALAADDRTPALERAKFLAIFSEHLDE